MTVRSLFSIIVRTRSVLEKSDQSYQETYLLILAGSNVNHVLFASVPLLTPLQLSSLASSSLVLPVPPVLSARLLSQPSSW